jgi:hypothetical protein
VTLSRSVLTGRDDRLRVVFFFEAGFLAVFFFAISV